MAKVLIVYASLSGSTKEVAEIVSATLSLCKHEVHTHRIGTEETPNLTEYEAILLGTYTWGKGRVPSEVKAFIAEVGYKPDNVFVFGTGDTQFGGESLFCYAVERLRVFYGIDHPGLKIEQSPRGSQEEKTREWAKGVSTKLWSL